MTNTHLRHIFTLTLILFSCTWSSLHAQENKVPMTVTEAWPGESTFLGDTKLKNLSDGRHYSSLTAEVDAQYHFLEYLQIKDANNTGYSAQDGLRSWIEIPYIPNADTEIEVVYENKTNVAQYKAQYIFGSDSPEYGGGYTLAVEQDNYVYWACEKSWKSADNSADIDIKHTAVCKLDKIKIDGTTYSTTPKNTPYEYHQTIRNIYFFSAPQLDQRYAYSYDGKIYGAKIRENGVLKHDLVPAKDGTDQYARCGFYDKVTNKFFAFFEMVEFVENRFCQLTPGNRNYLHFKIPYTPTNKTANRSWSSSSIVDPIPSTFGAPMSLENSATNAPEYSVKTDDGTYVEVNTKINYQEQADKTQLYFDLNETFQNGDEYYISFFFRSNHTVNVPVELRNKTGNTLSQSLGETASYTLVEWETGKKVWRKVVLQGTVSSASNRIAFNLNNTGAIDYTTLYHIKDFVVRKKSAGSLVTPNMELEIDFNNTYNNTNINPDLSEGTGDYDNLDGHTWRHLFAFGTKEREAMSFSVETRGNIGKYKYTYGGVDEETDQSTVRRGRTTARFRLGECDLFGRAYVSGGSDAWQDVQYLFLMGSHSTNEWIRSLHGVLYGAKITENIDGTPTVTLNLQPARNADGKWGLWDKVKKTFYGKCDLPGAFNAADDVDFTGALTSNAEGIPEVGVTYSFVMETSLAIKPVRLDYVTGQTDKPNTVPKTLKLYGWDESSKQWDELRIGRFTPKFSTPVADGTTEYYLYNIETGTFLVGANNWNSQASVHRDNRTNAHRFRLSETDGKYTLENYVLNGSNKNAWHALYYNGLVWVDYTGTVGENNSANWHINETATGSKVYIITNEAVTSGALGTYSDVINSVSNTRLYLEENVTNTHWAFVNAADYTEYCAKVDANDYSYNNDAEGFPMESNNWFSIIDNSNAYKKYQLDVTVKSGNMIHLAELALTANYEFEHYEGRVYEGSTENDSRIPADLRWGSSSAYNSMWKNKADDNMLTPVATIQRTHEYVHEVYTLPDNTVLLTPFEDFKSTGNYKDTYVRWYRYSDSDGAGVDTRSANLYFEPQWGTNVLVTDKGHFSGPAFFTDNREIGTVAKFNIGPQDPRRPRSIFDVVACEASNSFKANNELSLTGDNCKIKEPTLTWRHIFVIKNAEKRRDAMIGGIGALSASERKTANDNYIAANRMHLMCPENTPFQYPLPFHEYATKNGKHSYPTDYYGKDNKPVFHYRIETWQNNSGGDPVLLGSTRLKYNSSTNEKGVIVYKKVSDNDLTDEEKKRVAISFKEINGYNRVFYIEKPVAGNYTIKIFAQDKDDQDIDVMGVSPAADAPMQIMEYELTVLPPRKAAMVNETTLETSEYAHQAPAKLVRTYGKATASVDFDDIDPELTQSKNGDRYYKWPIRWEDSSYGFGFDQRYDYNMYMLADHSKITPFPNYDVYDRKYVETGVRGFFLHANAASDPGHLVSLNIGRNFCPNTTVYVSAWLCELQHQDRYAETANVVFSFRGVRADGTQTILNSFVSGYISGGWNTPTGYKPKTKDSGGNDVYNHIDATNNPDNRGRWMHVYYTFQPAGDVAARAAEFDHYILTLENNCTSSQGADYIIDDVRAFVCRPQINARQTQPICNGEISTAIDLFGDFDKFLESFAFEETDAAHNVEKTFCYSFLDYDKYEAKMQEAYDALPDATKTLYPTLEKWRMGVALSESTFRAAYTAAFNEALITGSYGGSSSATYGTLKINTTYELNDGWEIVGDTRNLNFAASATDADIRVGKRYIIALMDATDRDLASAPLTSADYEIEGACSQAGLLEIVANFGQVKIDGTLTSDLQDLSFCANQKPMVTINLNGIRKGGEVVSASSTWFDWYIGPVTAQAEYDTNYEAENNGGGIDLKDAVEMLRAHYRTATQEDVMGTSGSPVTVTGSDPANDFTSEMLTYIQSMVTAGKLVLYQRTETLSTADQFGTDRKSKFYITAIPINPTDPSEQVTFCLEPLQISVNLNPRSPSLQDGHHAISYPAEMKDVPLRIGLSQLERTTISSLSHDWVANAATDNLLRIPLRNVQPSKDEHDADLGTELKKLVLTRADDDLVYLINTTDPDVTGGIDLNDYPGDTYEDLVSDLRVIGRVKNIVASKSTITDNICHLAFLEDFRFREGYEYTIKFHFEDYVGHKPLNACPGDAVFTIKVVPEYMMWTGAVSRNWNDDRNWKRVTREELLNPTEATVPDEFVVGSSNANTAAFVPADFTKVIIPADCQRVPYLYNMREGTNLTSVKFAGAVDDNSKYREETAPLGAEATLISSATTNINYDMASEDIIVGGVAKDVACRPWYDHTCREIHFMSGAEIMAQQYLDYQKAWCDIDVTPGTWKTIASPLTHVVAGDFYLPTATARQESPLFEDITYSTGLNDRFKPAVYQRSWNRNMAKVYQLADGNVTDRSVGVVLDWSKVYNDVNVQYGAGLGFATKVDVSTMPAGDRPATATFRLPKADLSYTYYSPGNTDGTHMTEAVKDAEGNAVAARSGRLADFTSSFQQTVGDGDGSATATSYFLVGNPFVCWLDMQAFFAVNPQLESKYWIVTGEGQHTSLFSEEEGWVTTLSGDARYVAPYRSFFVKMRTGTVTSQDLTFTPAMMSYAQGEVPLPASAPLRPGFSAMSGESATRSAAAGIQHLTITATDSVTGMQSRSIILNSGAESAETLFDTNLSDHIQLYTVTGGQAQTIAAAARCDTLPLIVSGSMGATTLHVQGAADYSAQLYLVDGETGTTTPLTSDLTFHQSTNGVRYYIMAQREDDQPHEMDELSMPRIEIHGSSLTLHAPTNGEITTATIHTTGGALVAERQHIATSATLTLPTDIYIVRLSANSKTFTYKVRLVEK